MTVTATDPCGLSAGTEIVVAGLASIFRNDFGGSGGLAAGWTVRMADARIAGGVLNLANAGATHGEAARALKDVEGPHQRGPRERRRVRGGHHPGDRP